MQPIKKMYRSEYTGEKVLTNAIWRNAEWTYQQEYVPNRVENNQISNSACVIGNGYSREKFEMFLLADHKGGMGGSKALQTYGCNALYRDFTPQFLVATGDEIVHEIATSGYCQDHIVYANSQNILRYPGNFYLIPQDPHLNSGTLAVYLACFDGHKTVYLLGFDNAAGQNLNNNIYAGTPCYGPKDQDYSDEFFVRSMWQVMTTYSDVEFIRVMPTESWHVPDEWKSLPNFRQVNVGQFVILADL